jgi:succinate dehydrogenase hydrophobic anchor subunit
MFQDKPKRPWDRIPKITLPKNKNWGFWLMAISGVALVAFVVVVIVYAVK